VIHAYIHTHFEEEGEEFAAENVEWKKERKIIHLVGFIRSPCVFVDMYIYYTTITPPCV